MQFAILGPLEVRADDQRLDIRGPQHRALLAVLLLNANRVVSTDRLIRCLWGDDPPASARSLLQGCVAGLRRMVQTEKDGAIRQPLLTRPPGYLLKVEAGELDLDRFEHLVTAARAAGEPGRTGALLHEALNLWRGPALADVPAEACRGEAARLDERRRAVVEERVEADLRMGRHADVIAELRAAVAEEPLRERLWALLMTALHGANRQAEALAAYRELRGILVDQLGVEPGPTVRRIHRHILSGSAPPPEPARAEPTNPEPTNPEPTNPEPTNPARTNPARTNPAQLPAAVAAFVGRDEELRRIDALVPVDGIAIVVVSGTAGVGKTALATHWAHRVRHRFPDGQFYVNLRGHALDLPTHPMAAIGGFLHALGVPADQLPAEVEQAAALYRTLTADHRLLVLLDDAHDADQVRPLLPASGGSLVLVTSRATLGGLVARDGAHRIALDVLDPAAARALLAGVLGAERVAAEPDATDRLARACGRLPLALRIAAANLGDQPTRDIAGYAAELSGRDRLDGLTVDGDERATVRVAFDRSYVDVPIPARRMFRLLSLAPGPDLSVAAAAALADIADGDAGRLLVRLSAAHLLTRPAPGRFGFHDLLRVYAAEHADSDETPTGRAAALHRLFTWYARTADAAARAMYPTMLRVPDGPTGTAPFAGHAEALAWLDAERANLVAAVSHAARHGAGWFAWRLADTLRGYLWYRMHVIDWQTVGECGVAAADADGDPRARAATRLVLADCARCQSRNDEAIGHYRAALALAECAGWEHCQATALSGIGIAYGQAGRPTEAVGYFHRALTIDRRTGRLAGETAVLGNLGVVYRELGRLVESAEHHAQALAINERIGCVGGIAIDLSNLGEAYHGMGDLDRALDHLDRALGLAREVGDRAGESETLRRLADVHRDAGRPGARDLAGSALRLARETGERRFEADASASLAAVLADEGQHAAAVREYRRALRLAHDCRAGYPAVIALTGLATAHLRLNRLDEATGHARQAVTLARRGGFAALEAKARAALARIRAGGDADRSRVGAVSGSPGAPGTPAG